VIVSVTLRLCGLAALLTAQIFYNIFLSVLGNKSA